jgi:hypothetical protein
MNYEPDNLVDDALMSEVGDGYYIQVLSSYGDERYYTVLHQEVDTLDDDSIKNYWEVFTYRARDNELVNNTGIMDNYPEALQNYAWHLDLYYEKTLSEVMPSTNINGEGNNE